MVLFITSVHLMILFQKHVTLFIAFALLILLQENITLFIVAVHLMISLQE